MILGGDIWVYLADFLRFMPYLPNFKQNSRSVINCKKCLITLSINLISLCKGTISLSKPHLRCSFRNSSYIWLVLFKYPD